MRIIHLSGGLFVTLAVVLPVQRSAADGILPRPCATCGDAKQQVIRLPAQEIQVLTTAPRIIVNSNATPRMRTGFGVHAVPFGVTPMFQTGPFVASVFVPQTNASTTTSSAASVLKAYHDLEIQSMEVARQKAAHAAETKAINQVHQRIQSNLAASAQTSSDPAPADVTTQLSSLNNRITAIEQLLLIHDKALKDVLSKQSGK